MMMDKWTNGGQTMDNEKSICLCQNDGQMDGVCMYTHHLSIVAMRPICKS